MQSLAYLAAVTSSQLLALHWYGWHGFVLVVIVQASSAVLHVGRAV